MKLGMYLRPSRDHKRQPSSHRCSRQHTNRYPSSRSAGTYPVSLLLGHQGYQLSRPRRASLQYNLFQSDRLSQHHRHLPKRDPREFNPRYRSKRQIILNSHPLLKCRRTLPKPRTYPRFWTGTQDI